MKTTVIIVAAILVLTAAFYVGRGSGLDFFENQPNSTSTPIEAGMREIYVYFSNSELDPEVTCVKVFPVRREVEDAPLAPRRALEVLLAGPVAAEKDAGYETLLPAGTILNNLVVSGTVATADFNEQLAKVAGSCMVTAITSQITETLRQFSPINTVIITINGRSEGVLQP